MRSAEIFEASLGDLVKAGTLTLLAIWCSAPGATMRFRRKKRARRN